MLPYSSVAALKPSPFGKRLHFVHDYRTLEARVFGDLPQRFFQSAAHDGDAVLFVGRAAEVVKGGLHVEQSHAAAGNDAFFHCGAGGGKGVLEAVFLLFEFRFRRRAHFDDRNAAREFGKALLQFLFVVGGIGLFNLTLDQVDAAHDGLFGSAAFDNGGLVLADGDFRGAAEVGEVGVFQFDAEVVADEFAVGEDGNIFQHGLAAVAEAGGLDRNAS